MQNHLQHFDKHPTASPNWTYTFDKIPLFAAWRNSKNLPTALIRPGAVRLPWTFIRDWRHDESARINMRRSVLLVLSTAHLLFSVLDVDGLLDPLVSWVEPQLWTQFHYAGFQQTYFSIHILQSPMNFYLFLYSSSGNIKNLLNYLFEMKTNYKKICWLFSIIWMQVIILLVRSLLFNT